MFTILIVVYSLIGLIILHEFGHFVLAKLFGVRVEEFGIGYPPRIIGKKIGETLYSLNLIPFGAFVKIHGEEGGIESAHSFSGKPIWQRALIILGGVVSFWIIAVILLSVVFGLGVPQVISDEEREANPRVQVIAIAPNSPAELAGIQIGDTIKQLTINPEQILPELYGAGNQQLTINKVKEVQEFTEIHKGEEVVLTIERGKEIFDLKLIPRVSPPIGEGAMGVGLARTAVKKYPWYSVPIKGVKLCLKLTTEIFSGLIKITSDLLTGKGLPVGIQIMGPVGIGSLLNQTVQLGIVYYLQSIGLLAVYLAIFNLLPIPALDGGKLLFLGIEAIRKKPVNPKIEQGVTNLFFAFLIILMILVTIKDISRLF